MNKMDSNKTTYCREEDRWSRSFKVGVNPLGYTLPIMLIQIVMVVFISRVLHIGLRYLKQPKFVCQILAGIIIGPSILGRIDEFKKVIYLERETITLDTMATIGVIYYLFIIAVKMDLTLVLNSGTKVLIIGFTSVIVPLVSTFGLYYIFHTFFSGKVENQENLLQIFCGLFSMTAFPHVAQLMDEINLLTSELGELALACAIVNDMIKWYLVLLIFLGQYQPKGLITNAISVSIVIGFLFLFIRPTILWIIKKTPRGKPVDQFFVMTILVGALIMGYISRTFFGLAAVGATVWGLMIPAGPPLGATLVQNTELFVSEFFLPCFFVLIGLNTDVSLIKDWDRFFMYQLFFFTGFATKIAGTMLIASGFYKMSLKKSALLGLILNTKGVMEADIVREFRSPNETREQLDGQMTATLIIFLVAISAIVPPLIEIYYNPDHKITSDMRRGRTVQSALKNDEFRLLLCVHEEEEHQNAVVRSLISLLEASNSPSKGISSLCAYVIHLVELVGSDAPLLIPYDSRRRSRAHAMTGWKSSMTSDHIMRAFVNYGKSENVMVRPFTMVAPFKTMHDYIRKLAYEKVIPLIIVPFPKSNCNSGVVDDGGGLRYINNNIRDYAPCTVGILVGNGGNGALMTAEGNLVRNNSESVRAREGLHYYNVVVIFMGGADDREALAYGIRMLGNPDFNVTLLHIVILSNDNNGGTLDYSHDESLIKTHMTEKILDESLVNQFKLTMGADNKKSARDVLYREEVVGDIGDAINIVSTLENVYDLVIVGRRRGITNQQFDKEMLEWTENPELGAIGDVLISSELFEGNASLLAMQHFAKY